jgi:hypothetical protein
VDAFQPRATFRPLTSEVNPVGTEGAVVSPPPPPVGVNVTVRRGLEDAVFSLDHSRRLSVPGLTSLRVTVVPRTPLSTLVLASAL